MKKILFLCFLFMINLSIVSASNSKFKVTLDSCIDGDTARFNIKGEAKTVRFLSINTPEIAHDDVLAEPYGYEASNYTCQLLKNASVIRLQYDPKSDKEDKYGRVLAWVFVDDKLLQEVLVSEGYAEVKYVYNDYLYSNDLKVLEDKAKDMKIGIWSLFDVSSSNYNNFDYNYVYIFIGVVLFLIFFGRSLIGRH